MTKRILLRLTSVGCSLLMWSESMMAKLDVSYQYDCFDMIHALSVWDFPSFHGLWLWNVYRKHFFFTQTGGWPFFPAAFSERKWSRSLKENLPFTKCLTVRQKDPDDLVFAPHVVVTSNPSPPICFKSNYLDGVMESSFLLLSKF